MVSMIGFEKENRERAYPAVYVGELLLNNSPTAVHLWYFIIRHSVHCKALLQYKVHFEGVSEGVL
eukprot:881846-Pelagomonas_calceolata.AAC.6